VSNSDVCEWTLRFFKLVSGKIGSLTVKIPWKRLVWGDGDVQVNVRNITIKLVLESREETEQRLHCGGEETGHMDYFPAHGDEEDQGFEENVNDEEEFRRLY